MGRIAVNIGYDAKDVVLSGDPDKAAKLADDDAMDELHRHLFSVVMLPVGRIAAAIWHMLAGQR